MMFPDRLRFDLRISPSSNTELVTNQTNLFGLKADQTLRMEVRVTQSSNIPLKLNPTIREELEV